ncbi:MAG TPA: hypothetical protein VNJ54_11345 [Plantibacter sp.]|uniref:hypothetical protein n=1 Tax=Plantibacter sp. TaxID=1871045 RepID=UPI002CBC2793|nr:hypothetical protein [Plantibacter sp.]
MTVSIAEATREERVAEYIARDSVATVLGVIRDMMEGEDKDVLGRLVFAENKHADNLIIDHRQGELFCDLWPDDDATDADPRLHPMGVEAHRASAESSYVAARIMRTIVYHVDYMRSEAQRHFEFADKTHRRADEAEKDGDDA